MRHFSLVLIVSLLIATAAEAAIARRGVTEGHTASGNAVCATTAFGTTPVSGDTLVVAVSSFGATTTFTTPTDTGGNVYTQIGTTLVSSTVLMSVWRKENATGAASFIVTGHIGTTTNGCTAIAWDLSGANTPTSYNADKTSATNAASANPVSGSSTPAPAASSFFVGVMTNAGPEAVTSGSGWQVETNSTQTNNTSFQDLYTEDLTAVTASSAQSATWTAISDAWGAQVQSFAPAGGTCTPNLSLMGVGRCGD